MNRDKIIEVMAEGIYEAAPILLREESLKTAQFLLTHLHAKGLAVVQGWQPIESAPKDGTPVLVYGIGADNRGFTTLVRWVCGEHVFSSRHRCNTHPTAECDFGWHGDMAASWDVPFTHWMPLPAPPTNSPKEESDEC